MTQLNYYHIITMESDEERETRDVDTEKKKISQGDASQVGKVWTQS